MDTKHRRRPGRYGLLALVAGLCALRPAPAEAAEPRSKVILNGELVQVTFNDGDSFRVLSGDLAGAKARLAGYNTLESYGPVHQWGSWTEKELFVLAKMATMHARRGMWECTTDGATDTYGRMLVDCPVLAEDLIRRGMAHVLTVTDEGGAPALVAAQQEAMAAKRGLWSHGLPGYILTSIHSAEEDTSGKGTYNRLVSTVDGHSVKWRHSNKYQECQKVCHLEFPVDDAIVHETVIALRDDSGAAVMIESLDDKKLAAVVAEFMRYRHISRDVPEEHRVALRSHLLGYVASGQLGEQTQGQPSSCMTHIDFKRRFGTGRAACLK